MEIKSIVPYFGGKRNLANEIISALGKHSSYWEPFCGSLAVLLAKPAVSMEVAVDLYGEVINLASVLAGEDSAVKLYSMASRWLFCEGSFTDLAARVKADELLPADVEHPDVDRAFRFLAVSWAGRNGLTGTKSYNFSFCARYSSTGGHSAKRFISAIESIPWWHSRLRNVTFLNRDAFSVLNRIEDSPGVSIYVDPPYMNKTKNYIHDFVRTEKSSNHKDLAERLKRFKRSRVVLSYYDHPSLSEYYPNWHLKCFEVNKALSNTGDSAPSRECEVILSNLPMP